VLSHENVLLWVYNYEDIYCNSLREKESAVYPVSENGNTAIVNFCRMNIVPTSFNLICIRWGEGLPLVISWHK